MTTIDPVFSWIAALGCALLLMAAAVQKARAWHEFTATVLNYRVVPATLAPIAAALVAAGEAAASLLLLAPKTRAIGACLAGLLFMTYAAAIAMNLARGRTDIDCGCVGASKRRAIGPWMLWRSLALMTVALLAALPANARLLSSLDVATVCASLLILALLYLAFDQLGAVTSKARVST